MPVLEGKVPVAVPAARERAIHDAIAFAEKQHIKIVIMQPRELKNVAAGAEGEEYPGDPGPHRGAAGESKTLPTTRRSRCRREVLQGRREDSRSGPSNNEFARNLPYNAARAVAYGLPQDEALKAVTINAAEIWGAGDKMGSIEKGKWADLMVMDRRSVGAAESKMKRVYIKGKEMELTNKQTRLYQKYMARP